ncbi:protein kinase domain-containing protein [Oryzibacter oryziterrae]|uniref:protein kinase domain-containing protein n=1 Tax=Oryzibacter oryziterrae TaxID=2766474 RepID=UPI001F1C2872|nr:hypothetical protein [Oryzibacter oryziterrae]
MNANGPLTGQSLLQKPRKGAPVKLTTLVAESGEGAVYRCNRSGFVAKIYNKPQPEHFRKLLVMIARPPRDPAAPAVSIAWPVSILERSDGAPVGFLMPEISKAKRPTILYVPKARMQDAAGVDWYYLHAAALNVVRLFRAIHELGYVIGDVKPENLLVNASMQICAIDTDSFQVTDPTTKSVYRCPVGTPDYTPPELIGRSFTEVDRTPEHDLFGLAALVYLFLFGKHPFSGGTLPDALVGLETSERIVRGLWQWNRSIPLKPHRGALPLEIVHPDLVALFRRCFDRGGQRPKLRPTVQDWQTALEKAIEDLVWCQVSPLHVFAGHGSCPWCELARSGSGVDLFPARANITSSSFSHVINVLNRQVKNGDYVTAKSLFDRYPQLTSDPRTSQAWSETRKYAATLARFEAFRKAISRTADFDEENLALLKTTPTDVFQLTDKNPQTSPNLERLRLLAKAIDEVETAIRASKPTNGRYFLAGEQAILAAARAHATILQSAPSTYPRYAARMQDAWDRKEAFAALTNAETSGSLVSIAAVLDKHGPRLQQISEFNDRQARYADIRKVAVSLSDFLDAATRLGADPEVVCASWEATADLASSDLAREANPMFGGKSPTKVFEEFAARRTALRSLAETLERIAPTVRPVTEASLSAAYAEVSAYVKAYGAVPTLSPLLQRITALETATSVLAKLRKLAARGRKSTLDLARAWRAREGVDLSLDPDLGSAVASADALLTGVEAFIGMARSTACDETELLRLWMENGLDHPAAAKIALGEMTIRGRADLARRRLAAVAEMESLLAAADAGLERSRAGETALLEGWEHHAGVLAAWGDAIRRFSPRLELARQRLWRAAALSIAVQTRDVMAASSAWGADDLLASFREAKSDAQFGMDAARVVSTVEAVMSQLSIAPESETEALVSLGGVLERSLPSVSAAPLSLLAGRTPLDFEIQLKARAVFRSSLQRCNSADGSAMFALAEAWKAEFGDADRRFAESPVLKDALALLSRWRQLCEAAQTGADATVASLWTDSRVEAAPDFADRAPGLIEALRSFLDRESCFLSLQLKGITINPDCTLKLCWIWKDPRVTHAEIVVGDQYAEKAARAETITHHCVTKAQFDASNGFLVSSPGRQVVALVYPAFVLGGRLVRSRRQIKVQENTLRTLRYRIYANTLRSDEQQIELQIDRPVSLPPLYLLTEAKEVVARLEAQPFDDTARLLITLPIRSSLLKRKKLVHLDHVLPDDAKWLEIVHPASANRKMVVR